MPEDKVISIAAEASTLTFLLEGHYQVGFRCTERLVAHPRESQHSALIVVWSELNSQFLVLLANFLSRFGSLHIDVSIIIDFLQSSVVEFKHGAGDFQLNIIGTRFLGHLVEHVQIVSLLFQLVAEGIGEAECLSEGCVRVAVVNVTLPMTAIVVCNALGH